MGSILIFGDLHLKRWSASQIDAQTKCIINTIKKHKPSHVLFLGDVFEDRKPGPRTVKDVYNFFLDISEIDGIETVYIVRGNHDTDSKTNNVAEMSSMLEIIASAIKNIQFIKSCSYNRVENSNLRIGCIAHFEDDEIIKKHLATLGTKNLDFIFGHFGFDGCLSRSTYDFSINLDSFPTTSVLGHIHKFETYKNSKGTDVILLGTPYSTSWHDPGGAHYVMEIDLDTKKFHFHEVEGGVKHVTVDDYDLEDWMNNKIEKQFFYCLRVMLDPQKEEFQEQMKKLTKILPPNKANIDYRFRPIVSQDNKFTFLPSDVVDCINDELVEEYIDSSSTTLPKDKLLEILQELKNAKNQED